MNAALRRARRRAAVVQFVVGAVAVALLGAQVLALLIMGGAS